MAEGLAATKQLASEGIAVNMTLVFSAPQAIMAARAGARYISPFVGRFDDIAEDGLNQLNDIVSCVNNYDFGHEVEDHCRFRAFSPSCHAGRPYGCRHRHGAFRCAEEVH